jgi:hypothetical protein
MKTKNTQKLVSVNSDAKTIKGNGKGWLTGIVYLAPANVAGLGNMCPWASEGCKAVCLFNAGRASMFPKINEARIRRTHFLVHDRAGFRAQLEKEIRALVRKANRLGLSPAFRFNGTSDLAVDKLFPGLIESFPEVSWYDYTKSIKRALEFAEGKLPANYHVTFSLSEDNSQWALQALAAGVNVTAVVDKPKAFETFTINGARFRTIDGDESDLRFLDPQASTGRIVLLKAKGPARKDTTGFVERAI